MNLSATKLPVDRFLRTLYLGDRGIDSVHLDLRDNTVVVTVNLLSRIRSPDGRWDFYSAEDIVGARLVFTGVTAFSMDPPGLLPDDFIYSISAVPLDANRWRFVIEVGSANAGMTNEVTISVDGADAHLEDPRVPGVPIRE